VPPLHTNPAFAAFKNFVIPRTISIVEERERDGESSAAMKADPLAAHRKVESLTGEGFLRRELALALRVSRSETTRDTKCREGGGLPCGLGA